MENELRSNWELVKPIADWVLANHSDKLSYFGSTVGTSFNYISITLRMDDASRIFLKDFAQFYGVTKLSRDKNYPTQLNCVVEGVNIKIDGIKTAYSVSCEKVCTATFPDGRKIILTPTEIDIETAVSE